MKTIITLTKSDLTNYAGYEHNGYKLREKDGSFWWCKKGARKGIPITEGEWIQTEDGFNKVKLTKDNLESMVALGETLSEWRKYKEIATGIAFSIYIH